MVFFFAPLQAVIDLSNSGALFFWIVLTLTIDISIMPCYNMYNFVRKIGGFRHFVVRPFLLETKAVTKGDVSYGRYKSRW